MKYTTRSIETKTPDGKKEYISRIERAQRFGVEDKIPEEPEIPELGTHIMGWFWELNSRRVMGMEMPHPLSFTEIDAWRRLTNTYVLHEEIEALIAIDSAYLMQIAKNKEARQS